MSSGVLVFVICLIAYSTKKVEYSNCALIGLVFWEFIHLLGATVTIDGILIYKYLLIPIGTDFFRYDQFVHIVGFMFATIVLYETLKPMLKVPYKSKIIISILIVIIGMGIGAFNENIEFIATLLSPNIPIGGYINTSLDMISNLVGAVFALVYIRIKEKW